MRTVRLAGLTSAVAFGLAAFSTASSASVYDFIQNGSVIAEATTQTSGSGVQVDIQIKDSSYFFIQAGNPPMVTWDSPNTSLTTAPTQNPGGSATWQLGPFATNNGSPYNTGGAGSFTQALGFLPKSNTIFNTDIIFTLGNLALTDFSANSLGYFFGADFCHNTDAASGQSGCGGSGQTAFIGATAAVNAVPLPPAALLFGSALLGLGMLTRRRQRGLTPTAV